jgi:hypothetical protein
MLMKRDEGGEVRPSWKEPQGASFDDLAMGLNSGAISRGRAIKLAGAALLSGALGVFAAAGPAEARRRCRRNEVRCVRRRNGRRRVFCCPRAEVQLTSCRTAIVRDLCVRIDL